MSNETTIVEINGVKLEVDLRHATVVHENIKIGSRVKLLEKSDYSGPSVRPGVVVGFENFETMPTIIVAYIDVGYGVECPVKMAYINGSGKAREKWEMVPAHDDDVPLAKEDVLTKFDKSIEEAKAKAADLEQRRSYFLRHFGAYFEATETA